ncbi:MAG: Ribonuclease [Candidatus Thermoplasmatota archaeon]|nr:Ribonuclease [Candidatus Thermoplasmatota archaeon]
MKLVFLGVGGTYPSKMRNVTSLAVQMGPEVLLFDCGEGIQRQLMCSSVSFMRIRRIFISHLHADHFLGLPGLIQSMSLNGRQEELEICGPQGIAKTVRSLMNLGYFKSGYKVRARTLSPGDSLACDGYRVTAAAADHTVPALAYAVEEDLRGGRFDIRKAKALGVPAGPMFSALQRGERVRVKGKVVRPEQVLGPPRPGRKVAFSGDTRKCRAVIELAKGADALVHDCTLDSRYSELARTFGHSTARNAAEVAKEAGVRSLFLVHISPRYDDPSILVREARKVFRKSAVPEELSEHEIRLGK